MKTLLCSIPDGSIENTLKPLIPREKKETWSMIWRPVGILRIVSWMEEKGYTAEIYDINNFRPTDEELIKNFKKIKPTVVGLSATLTHCYPNTKRITKILRQLFPDVWIIVGGGLTSSANVLLDKTETDICVVGDGEIPFVKILDYINLHPSRHEMDYSELSKIKGLAYIDQNKKLKVTGNAQQLTESQINYPSYDKLKPGFKEFYGDTELIHEYFDVIKNSTELKESVYGAEFYKKNLGGKIGEIESSRGCVARCTFCQRSTKGYRVYAADDLERHICELKDKYNVKSIILTDENALSNKKQGYEIARIMKKHNILWTCTCRVTTVTYEDLKFYRDHNLFSITFGIESGSQKILDIMEKKFKKEDVHQAISWCAELGIHTKPNALMLGMPGETKETVIESAEFVASLRHTLGFSWEASTPFLAMSIPGTPLYEYSQQIGVIGKTLDEEEDYLMRISNYKNTSILNYVNKTDASMKEVHYWIYLYNYANRKGYINLILNSDRTIKDKLKKIYQIGIKGSIDELIKAYNDRKNFYKGKKYIYKTKWFILLFANFLISISCAILPKPILFYLVRIYSNLRLYSLTKKNKAREQRKEKNNFFFESSNEEVKDSKITDERISEEERYIKRSLRTIVSTNRNQMKPATNQEEKGMQVLAEGQ